MFLYKTKSKHVPAESVPDSEVSEWLSESETAIVLALRPRQVAAMLNGDTWERIK